MSIKTGRYGTVKYASNGAASPLTSLVSINGWKLSLKTDYEDVSCFGDTNKVYIQGLRDVSGSITGFWNSSSTVLIDAGTAPTPGYLQLAPNSTESAFVFGGLAYLDADIDCTVKGAPKLTGTFKAAGAWTVP